MKVYHDASIDFTSIEFREGVEAKSYMENGIIVREDEDGKILGIDITDSTNFFLSEEVLTFKEACRFLGISESTLRRRIKAGKVPYKKKNRNFYRFNKKDLMKIKKDG
jgi:excisionase family DNA binding protein